MRVPFSEIMACADSRTLSDKLSEIISRYTPDNPPSLSDNIVNVRAGGHHVNLELAAMADMDEQVKRPHDQRFRWHIEVIRDEWGRKPQPGDKVVRILKLPYKDRDGNVIGGHDLSRMIADGTFKQRFEIEVEFEVDEKGCIECEYHDAMHFLNLRGIHHTTRVPMTNKPEQSAEPADYPGGGKKHVWYWRYREVPKEEYDKMPTIKPKKGYGK